MKGRWRLGVVPSSFIAFGSGVLLTHLVWGRPDWFGFLWTAEAAGWAAALATVAAVVVALTAAEKERQKSIYLQEREWDRGDKQRRLKAARLAHAFNRDLVRAHREIKLDRQNRRLALGLDDIGVLSAYLLHRRPVIHLPMIDRFANELDGFEDRDALALLNMLASCSDLSRRVETPLHEMSMERAVKMASVIEQQSRVISEELIKLNDRLLDYFKDFPDMTIVDDDAE